MLDAREFNAALDTAETVTRIEIEITSPETFRWTVSDGDHPLYVGDGHGREIEAAITVSELLLKGLLGLPFESRRINYRWN